MSSGQSVIAVNDPNLLEGLSPLNWLSKDTSLAATVCGASLSLSFRHTRVVRLMVDTSHCTMASRSRFPVVAWSVNGGAVKAHQLAPGETSLNLSIDIPDPAIEFFIKGMSPFEDRFTGDVPANSVRITGLVVDAGGSVAGNPRGGIWLNIGDSIMSGDAAGSAAGRGRPADERWAEAGDARASYGYRLTTRFGYREGRIAFGGYNWGSGLGSVPPLVTLIDQRSSTISRLRGTKLDPIPDVVLINLGENGVPAEQDVIPALRRVRSRVREATNIIVMIPVSGRGRSEIADAFNRYRSDSQDEQAHLVDLGQIAFETADGQHPTAAGHQAIFEAAIAPLESIISSGHCPGASEANAPKPSSPVRD